MRVLVTGGFGYLGGRIAKFLLDEGYDIVLGSRMKKSVPQWAAKANVVSLDWEDDNLLRKVCSGVGSIIHCAGMNARDCALDPVSALKFNGVATSKLVRACKETRVSKLVYLSTAHVYSSQLMGKITEETCPSNKHPYATTNLAGENALLNEPNNSEGFSRIILRLSNGVGTPIHKNVDCWDLLVNDLCKQSVKNKKLIVNSSRTTQRDFFPINLLGDTILSILKQDKLNDSVINVCSSRGSTLEEIANIICERSKIILDHRPDVEYKSEKKSSEINNLLISGDLLKKYTATERNIIDEIDKLLKNCCKWFG